MKPAQMLRLMWQPCVLYAGNAVVLRGGSDAENTNKILVDIIRRAFKK